MKDVLTHLEKLRADAAATGSSAPTVS